MDLILKLNDGIVPRIQFFAKILDDFACLFVPLLLQHSLCICKVNVATALSMALIRGTAERLKENPKQKDFRKVFDLGMDYISESIEDYVKLFGAAGKAYNAGWAPAKLPEITKESPE